MKNEKVMLRAALLRIAVYVAAMSLYENVGRERFGEPGRFLTVGALLLALALGMRRQGLSFREAPLSALFCAKYLYLLPMAALATVNLWNGAARRFSAADTAFYVGAMLMIGAVEELLFRGYLLGAMLRESVGAAVLVTGLTFGLGHIVNLANGADLAETLLQLVYAAAIGLMLSAFMVRARNIVPCCVFHGAFNALAAFGREEGQTMGYMVAVCAAVTALSLGYAWYLWRLPAKEETA